MVELVTVESVVLFDEAEVEVEPAGEEAVLEVVIVELIVDDVWVDEET